MTDREEFEAWKKYPIDRSTEPNYTHEYSSPITQAQWTSWQAAKEPIRKEVEEQEVEEQEVLKLAKECGVTNDTRHGQEVYFYRFEYPFKLNEFASKLRAKDAEEIASLKAQLAHQTKQGADRLIGLCKCGLERDELKAQLAEAQKVPEGWKLVPIKPDANMLMAGRAMMHHTPDTHWHAMLSASPKEQKP